MKKLLAIALLIPFGVKAQDSCRLLTSHDVYTKETKMSTGFMPLSNNGTQIELTVDATKSEIDFFLWLKDDGKCFNSESTIQVLFEGDRYKANFRNAGTTNCKGAFHFTFRNLATTPPNLRRLLEKRIAGMKITGTGGTVTELSFSDEQKELLHTKINCLVTQSKALIKK